MARSKTAKAKARKVATKESAKRTQDTSAAAAPAAPLIKPPEQHSLPLSILLHLLPGILATAVFVLLGPIFADQGIPSVATFLVSALLTVLPFELGILLWEARRKNQSSSLVGVVLYRAFLPWWQYIVFPLLLIVWAAISFGGLTYLLNQPIIDALFRWLPDWYFFTTLMTNIDTYSRFGLILTVILLVGFNGLAGPIIEELYFRGYLLPRLSRYGKWAPVINIVLFSLYHLWTPWEFLARIAALLPMAYVVRWKKNIYLGMITHVLLNSVGLIGTVMLIIGQLQK